jgi:hypothetical protein
MTDYTSKKWNSLNDLKRAIENDKKETVIDFNGHTLLTKKWQYQLYDGILIRKKR